MGDQPSRAGKLVEIVLFVSPCVLCKACICSVTTNKAVSPSSMCPFPMTIYMHNHSLATDLAVEEIKRGGHPSTDPMEHRALDYLLQSTFQCLYFDELCCIHEMMYHMIILSKGNGVGSSLHAVESASGPNKPTV